jgi:hypothetical protein
MSTWTPEGVLALAPDPGSAKSAQGLAGAKQWESLGRDDIALWGEIRGSGSTPYQARIDLREPAFKCSCPSRKFPCKHGLALLLIFARDASVFKVQERPAWVSAWLDGREQREEKRAEKAKDAPPVDAKARERRTERREGRIESGLEQLQVWLGDLVRVGLANAKTQPPAYWEAMAARLVDAQAPGLARLVGQLEGLTHTGLGWESRLLHAVARIELVRLAYGRRADLSGDLAEEVRTAIGWTRTQEELDAQPAIADRWRVLGVALENEDRLRVRRTWLRGRASARPALLLDFAAGTQVMDAGLPVGCEFDGGLAFYPGTTQLRAVVRTREGLPKASDGTLPGAPTIEAALGEYALALGRTPWLERWPMALSSMRVTVQARDDGPAFASVVDGEGKRIALPPRFPQAWHLLAVSGGAAVQLFGEWDGDTFTPLTVGAGNAIFAVAGGLTAMRTMAAA